MGGLLQPGPTLAQAEELRAKRGSRGLLEAIGTPLSYAPLAPVAALGQGLLGARYLTGEAEPMQGMASLSDMTAMMVGSRLPPMVRNVVKMRPEYQGEHRPAMRDGGAPAYDLTGGGKVYPDDIYSPMASQYYGHYGSNHPLDVQTIGLLHGVKNKPNATVTIYRAVPYEPTAAEQLAKLEKQKAQYLARRIVPPEWGGSRKSIGDEVGFYEHITKEIERLKAIQDSPTPKVTINPGDWVTPNRAYAKEHGESALGGNYRIVSKKVKAKDIFTNGDSIHEWGYDPN